MSFRLSPYKVVRLLLIIAVLSYGYVEIMEFRKNKIKNTEEVGKTLEIRQKDFYNSDEAKKKMTEEKLQLSDDSEIQEISPQSPDGDTVTNKDVEKTGNENESKEAAEARKKAEEQKKKEEEQKRLTAQLAQRKKEEAAKKSKEAEAIAAKKAKEAAAARKAKAESEAKKTSETPKMSKKYIQVATLNTEAAAKSAVSKLGGNFNYQKISGKKTMYVIVSISTDNPATLASLENQVKTKLKGTKYIIRTVGKK